MIDNVGNANNAEDGFALQRILVRARFQLQVILWPSIAALSAARENNGRWYPLIESISTDRYAKRHGDFDELDRAIRRAVAFPLSYPEIELGIRRCRLARFPYGVTYGVEGEREALDRMHFERITIKPDVCAADAYDPRNADYREPCPRNARRWHDG